MSVASKILQLRNDITNAYNSVANKGGTVPTNKNTNNLANAISTISGGGSTGAYLVKAIDYDGTLLKQEYLDTGDTFTLPNAPIHTGLTFQNWVATVPISNNTVTVSNNDIMIGAIYTTASGLNEFDIELNAVTGLEITFNLSGTKNWGDGTSDTATTHIYSNYGKYTISCDATTMESYLSTRNLFGGGASDNRTYFLKAIRIATITQLKQYCFYNCVGAENITLSNSVTSIQGDCWGSVKFNALILPSTITNIPNWFSSSAKKIVLPYGLLSIGRQLVSTNYVSKELILPNSLTTINADAFYGCQLDIEELKIPSSVRTIGNEAFASNKFKKMTIPNTVTSINFGNLFNTNQNLEEINIQTNGGAITMSSTFSGCTRLKEITIPSGITTISNDFAKTCSSLTKVVFPSSLTTINDNAFMSTYSNILFDFRNVSVVPSLGSSTCFNNIGDLTKMVVPDSLYSSWKTTGNWTTYADYIIKASDYTE